MYYMYKNNLVSKILFLGVIEPNEPDRGDETPLYAGIGGVAVLIVVAAILVALWKRNKKDEKETNEGCFSNVKFNNILVFYI